MPEEKSAERIDRQLVGRERRRKEEDLSGPRKHNVENEQRRPRSGCSFAERGGKKVKGPQHGHPTGEVTDLPSNPFALTPLEITEIGFKEVYLRESNWKKS